MDVSELRRRVGVILAAEEAEPRDWAQVERLSDELIQQLIAEPQIQCPETVSHYLDDSDIRSRDETYGKRQRDEVRRFVAAGEYRDSTPIPLWTCAVVLLFVIGIVFWIFW